MVSLFTTPDSNATTALHWLTQALRTRVSRIAVRETLTAHPDYPSVLSVSDALTDWHIDNAALKLSTSEQLRELPMPFIAHTQVDGGKYVVVKALAGDQITFTDGRNKDVTQLLTDFETTWSGTVLLAEADEKSGETTYIDSRQREHLQTGRIILLSVGIMLLATSSLWVTASSLPWISWVLLLTKTIGTFIATLLLLLQFNGRSTLVDSLCSLSGKTGCQNVLDAGAAKLTNWISWAEIGFFYFSGGLLSLLLFSAQPNTIPVLTILASVALPYTFFSVYYQWRVAKSWCVLCLLTQAVLAVEFVLTLSQWPMILPTLTPILFSAFTCSFGLPVLIYVGIKPFVIKAKKADSLQQELNRYKNDPDLLTSLLYKQPEAPSWLPDEMVVMGNPAAKNTIIMVTNPYCSPCESMHKELDRLLVTQSNFKVQIIFTTCDGLEGRMGKMANHLLSLPHTQRTSALHRWYDKPSGDRSSWFADYPSSENFHAGSVIIDQHCQWAEQAAITGTPTLYINGYKKPDKYSISLICQLFDRLSVGLTESSAL